MGKTKTAFITEAEEKQLSGKEVYEKRKKAKEEKQKIHISGLKGGQRVVAIESEPIEQVEKVEKAEKLRKGPKKRSKKYSESKSKVNTTKLYKIAEALKLLKDISYTKFDSTVEIHLVVKKDNLTANLTLPHSTWKTKKIELASSDTIKKLQIGKVDFDVLLATPEMMPKLVPFAKLLGPKGLYPNPKNGTFIKSEKDVSKFSTNSITLKTEKSAPLIHTTAGKLSMSEKELEENINAILEAVNTKQIIKAYINSTMSPGIKLAVS